MPTDEPTLVPWLWPKLLLYVSHFLLLAHKVGVLVPSGNDRVAAEWAGLSVGNPNHDTYTREADSEKDTRPSSCLLISASKPTAQRPRIDIENALVNGPG